MFFKLALQEVSQNDIGGVKIRLNRRARENSLLLMSLVPSCDERNEEGASVKVIVRNTRLTMRPILRLTKTESEFHKRVQYLWHSVNQRRIEYNLILHSATNPF